MKRTVIAISICAVAVVATAQSRLYHNEFPLGAVQVTDPMLSHARDLNIETLLSYDTDRLLAPYLKEAGLTPKAESFPNWDGLDGHVGGHYLSALAIHYASTGNQQLKQRMDYMLGELDRCRRANGDGYIGGVPGSRDLWSAVAAGNGDKVRERWVPWYNVHKTFAGLRDAWSYGGSELARDMFLGLCDWCVKLVEPLDSTAMERMLDVEFGGMNEVLADAYAMTGDTRYLDTARKFSHHWLLDSMAAGVDNLDNRHANTQVPKAIGYQRVAELGGDADQGRAARFFWETVVSNRSLAMGGNSRREHFASADDCDSYITDREGPETCNTYNMLKLTEGLFRMEPSSRLADFYERAMFNHILSTQHPGHGGYVYFTSARPGHYRVYSQPNSAMWCCVGSGMENHGKYGQLIYTHDDDNTLRVNLYVSSTLDWADRGVRLEQQTAMPLEGASTITVGVKRPGRFALKLRHPAWSGDGMTVTVNGKTAKATPGADGYVTLDRKWRNGDRVDVSMPMAARLEPLPNRPQYTAIMRGPVLLAARYPGTTDGLVAGDHRWGHIAHGELVNIYDTPMLVGERADLDSRLAAMTPVEGAPGHYTMPGLVDADGKPVELMPFASLHDSRYMMYWLTLTPAEHQALELRRAAEAAALALDRRTVDAVNTGEQQPEADHFMTHNLSAGGVAHDEPWRMAQAGGHFAYRMSTGGHTALSLLVRYHGAECAGSAFDILVDGNTVAGETIDAAGDDSFVSREYPIPAELVAGKDNVEVRFAARDSRPTAPVYHVRLVAPDADK